jgi:signal transduction histidine kinase
VTTEPQARLLIVDDERAQMRALCDTLKLEGYATQGFNSAREALAALRPGEVDLLITDLMMPEMDGIALSNAVRQVDPTVSTIVMTGHGTIDTAVRAMQEGALDYILKPFKLNVILPVIVRALDVRRLRRENAELEVRERRRSEELAAAYRDLESFSYSISHDLRAPLRHMSGYADLLQKKASAVLDEKSQRYMLMIQESAKRMGDLIDDLLAFSRIGRTETQKTLVNLEQLVKEALSEVRQETNGRNIVWNIGPLPNFYGDRSMLRLVFVNLLSNAVKFTRTRSEAKIEVGWDDGNQDEVVVFVRDNGVGFDMKYVNKLFGVFQRLHPAQAFEGTGIGLATVQRIVQRHGGKVWAEGTVDQGATFYFSAPKP